MFLFSVIFLLVTSNRIRPTYQWSLDNLLITSSQASLSNFETVWMGVQKGLDECARQFTFERWSCPESILPNAYQNNLPITREIAFVQAIISAGIVHSVTRNCSSGTIDHCKCSRAQYAGGEPTADFRWGGCSDDVELGYKIAKAYLDDRETGQDYRAKIRLHNHRVGRISVKETMVRKCKCHGVSGSCSMQTCWMKVPEFREVGAYLKKAYRQAIRIESNRPAEQTTAMADLPQRKLVYLQDSPDYCRARNSSTINGVIGTAGTLGRRCSMRKGDDVPAEESRSCRRLCKRCGYVVRRERRLVSTRCNCKFRFCCQVECQRCQREEFTYFCALPPVTTIRPSIAANHSTTINMAPSSLV